MKYENFKNIIDHYKDISERLYALDNVGVNLFESKYALSDPTCNLMTESFASHYNEEGVDWITWFIFESEYGEKYKKDKSFSAWDENKNPICYDYESLYEYLEKEHKL